jgi:hypothetical protein
MLLSMEELARRNTKTGPITMSELGAAGIGTPPQLMPPALSQPQQSQPMLLSQIFSPDNRDRFKRLAIGLEGMTMNPNQSLIGLLQGDLTKRQTDKDKNMTLAWLKTMPSQAAKTAAAALEAGAITASAAVSMAVSPAMDNVKVVGKRLIKVNEDGTTTDVTPGMDPNSQAPSLDGDQLGDLNKLQDDLRSQTATFQIVKSGYDNIQAFFSNPGAVSDYALAVGFAKIVDPGSVAREGEVAAVANAGSQFSALQQALQNAVTGEGKLPDDVRKEIARLATQIYANKAQEAQAMIAKYQDLAKRAGLPSDMVWMGGDVRPPSVTAAPIPGPTPAPAPAPVSPFSSFTPAP